MPVLELELPDFITYSGFTISCVVNNIPSGVTLTTGKAMIKRKKDDLDVDAIVTKIVTPSLVADAGQIIDTGADTQGTAIFIFTGTDTAAANPAIQARYEIGIKFYFSSGQPLTFAQCFVKPIQGVVQSLT